MNQIKSVFCVSTHFSLFLFSIAILSLLSSQRLSIINKNVLQKCQAVHFQRLVALLTHKNHEWAVSRLEYPMSPKASRMIFLFVFKVL